MGYKRPLRVLHLVFAGDSEYAGLEVKVRSLTLGEYYAMHAMDGEQEDKVFAERLVSWNVEDDDGTPVPATPEGLRSREPDETRAMKRAWLAAMSEVPQNDPLALSSTSGLAAMLELPAVELPAST